MGVHVNRPFLTCRLPLSVSKQVLVRNHSNENEIVLCDNGCACKTLLLMNGQQRQKITQKWLIRIDSDLLPTVDR